MLSGEGRTNPKTVTIEVVPEGLAEIVPLKQMPEVQDGGFVGHRLETEVDADEATDGEESYMRCVPIMGVGQKDDIGLLRREDFENDIDRQSASRPATIEDNMLPPI
jgi:hypothetical protein